MKRWIAFCCVLLAVQLGLTLWSGVYRARTTGPGAAVLALEPARIGELILEDRSGNRLVLRKIDSQWVVPAAGDFPADSQRIQGLIERLAGLTRGWPEATTAEAAVRFEVAADRFVRKLRLLQDGQVLRTLYFGISAGGGSTFFRMDGDTEVYAAHLGARDLDLSVDGWINPDVLAVQVGEVEQVHLPGLELARTPQGLQPTGLVSGEEVDAGLLAAVVEQVTRFPVKGLLGKERRPEFGLDKPALRYTMELAGGISRSYSFGLPQKTDKREKAGDASSGFHLAEGEAALHVSGMEQIFRVEAWRVEELGKATRAALVHTRQVPATALDAPPAVQGEAEPKQD
ncbi:MAG: DUF4340 domain-containing protein [Desulfobulbus sp.]|jgi:hypothetical protein